RGKVRQVDLGEANGRPFVNNLSIGMYPKIVRERERIMRLHGWHKRYAQILATLRIVTRPRTTRFELELARRRSRHAASILFMGNNEYAGGLRAQSRRPQLDSG